MNNETVTVVQDNGKGQAQEPVLTPTTKSRSDERLSKMVGKMAKTAEVYQKRYASQKGIPLPGSVVGDESKAGTAQGESRESSPTAPVGGQSPQDQQQPTTETQHAQPQQAQPQQEKLVVEPVKDKEGKAIDWEATAKKINEYARTHQSRADILENERKKWDAERQEYEQYKKSVEEFTKDPVGFLSEKLPDIAKQISAYGDPIKLIEKEVADYSKILLDEFKKEYGEDWQYRESEAITPGTPSFRYKLAIEAKVDEAREKYANYVRQRQEQVKNVEKEKLDAREKIKTEFGFSDDEIKSAEEYLSKTQISWYNLLRLALIDKIIERRLSSVVPPPSPPKDVTSVIPGSQGAPQEKYDLSPQTKLILSRLGTKRFTNR